MYPSHKENILKHKSHKENKLKHKSRTVIIIIIPAQSAQKHTARFEAIATELCAESAGNVRAMDLEAADLEYTPYQTHEDATEHFGPEIRIEKITMARRRTGGHHKRVPDIGLSIRAFIETGAATEHAVVTEYSGDYINHGQTKTVCKLHYHGGTFDGCILKVRKSDTDLEPFVFTRLSDYGITTNILHQAQGVEYSARPGHQISSRYHCWITEQAIP